MSKIIVKNLLEIETGFIIHQVNCQGVMGGGLALQISQKWPHVYESYKRVCDKEYEECFNNNKDLLGCIDMVQVDNDLRVISLFGQLFYGRKNKCYTDYNAHREAWIRIADEAFKDQVYAPYLIGADLAGGDWKVIHAIVEKEIPDIIWVKYNV